MFSWIGRSVSSAGGKQTILALTGLTLVGYLVLHLLGNLTLYTGGVEGLNEYSASLEALGVLLQVAEIGLLVLFVLHVGLALRITRENNLARADSEQAPASQAHPPPTGPPPPTPRRPRAASKPVARTTLAPPRTAMVPVTAPSGIVMHDLRAGLATQGRHRLVEMADDRAFAATFEELDRRLDLGSHAADRKLALGMQRLQLA